MKNFRQKLMSFMYGRYGVDELYYGLFGLWLALIIVNMFAHSYIIFIPCGVCCRRRKTNAAARTKPF